MKNILIFGASGAHGVGGERGGWADQLKASFHKEMYGAGGTGEVLQVYELGVPGTTLAAMLERFLAELHARVRKIDPNQTYILFSAGTNDSKAVDQIDNHLSTPQDFAANVHAFIHLAKEFSGHIIGVGIWRLTKQRLCLSGIHLRAAAHILGTSGSSSSSKHFKLPAKPKGRSLFPCLTRCLATGRSSTCGKMVCTLMLRGTIGFFLKLSRSCERQSGRLRVSA